MSPAVDLSAVPVVDGHCHPLLRDPADVSIGTFLDLFSEGRSGTTREHLTHAGYYRRALRALPELFALSAEWGRAALGEALDWLVERGDLDAGEAGSIARAILSDNARALYSLPIP